jgi:hypothetical protein
LKVLIFIVSAQVIYQSAIATLPEYLAMVPKFQYPNNSIQQRALCASSSTTEREKAAGFY